MMPVPARRVALVSLLAPVLLLGACSTPGSYPSLAVRNVERVNGNAGAAPGTATPPPPALPPASADLVTRLDGLVAVARDADRRFQAERGAAERAVAASGARGSDSWSSASVALARLESTRSQAMAALADLDTLYADARDQAPDDESPSAQAIAAARTEVAGLVAAQDTLIERLSARVQG